MVTRAVAHATCGVLLALALLAGAAAADGGGEDNLPMYWEVHAVLLSFATLFFVLSYIALWAKHLKRLEPLAIPGTKYLAKLWFKAHVWLGVAGVAFAVAGLAWGYVMVDWAYAGTHLRKPHAWVGFATLALVLPPLASGLVGRRVRKGKVAAKWWHLVLGFIGIAIMLAGAVTGWALE